MRKTVLYLTSLAVSLSLGWAQPVFKVIPLGVEGGNNESNLSAYAVAVSGTDAYVCLDAGTLYDGIERALSAQLLSGTVLEVLRNNIKGYLISHPHLDHIAGLILNSPDDSSRPISIGRAGRTLATEAHSRSSTNTAIRRYRCRKRCRWREHRCSFAHSR